MRMRHHLPCPQRKQVNVLKTVKKIAFTLSKICRIISGVLIVGMMLFVLTDVILRLVANSGFKFSFDLCTVLLMIITYFAMVPTQAENKHLHVTLIIRLMPRKAAYTLWGIFELLSGGICIYLLIATFIKTSKDAARNVMLNILGVPVAPFEYIACIGLALFCLMFFFGALVSFMALKDEECDETMRDVMQL